jgi:hypothetical protein
LKNDIESFIVRIWNEGIDNQGHMTTWRGSIDHVGTNSRFYFNDLEGMVRFIESQTGIVARPSKSWRHFITKWLRDNRHFFGTKKHAQDTN